MFYKNKGNHLLAGRSGGAAIQASSSLPPFTLRPEPAFEKTDQQEHKNPADAQQQHPGQPIQPQRAT
jgi:hypothetical protein